jgi:predicted AlkP superfamily pyrophosphatase or phosphodiesterase
MRILKWLPLAAIFFTMGFASPSPKLVVYIGIDQFPYHILERLNPHFTGGFRWLLDHGHLYSNMHHDHAYTVTGTGYFALGSGMHPGTGGILGNSWYDRIRGKKVNCVEDPKAKPLGYPGRERSYRLVNATALGDWMKDANPDSKVYSIGGKDRAAIFLGGKNPNLALWYNGKGQFMTTTYYTNRNPNWLRSFNRRLNLDSYRDSVWTRELDASVYLDIARPDHFEGEMDTYASEPFSPVFPIGFDDGISKKEVYAWMPARPWFGRMTLNLAQTIVDNENLGQDSVVDLLAIGLTSPDYMGHDYGPYSQEIADVFFKLDQYLADFLSSLDSSVGLDNILFIMSSDHGAATIPEYASLSGIETGRIKRSVITTAFENARQEIRNQYGPFEFFHIYGQTVYFFQDKMDNLGIDRSSIVSIFRQAFKDIKGIRGVVDLRTLESSGLSESEERMFQNMIHPELSPDLMILEKEHYLLWKEIGTTHGTPYAYDTHVPLIFSSPFFLQEVHDNRQISVNIAPTISRILNIPFPEKVDGKPILSEIE